MSMERVFLSSADGSWMYRLGSERLGLTLQWAMLECVERRRYYGICLRLGEFRPKLRIRFKVPPERMPDVASIS
jgi:hypothetical protein